MRRSFFPCPFAFAALAALARDASADDQAFVDWPLTLPVMHFSADAGIGFGQHEAFTADPSNPTAPLRSQGTKLGWGSNLETTVGLPFLGELGARVGYRFGDNGAAADADRYGRLFDPVVSEPGNDTVTNPELHLRGTLVGLDVVEVGLETRVVLPTAKDAYFAATPGLPVRVHVPHLARLDTGVYFPVGFSSTTFFAVQVPAQLYFQFGDAFVGPLSGMRYDRAPSNDPCNDSNDCNVAYFTAGVGGGYSLASFLDVKAQVYSDRINSTGWSKRIGGGLGVGLRLP